MSPLSESLQLLYKSGRKRHGPLLPVFRSEPPKRFGSHAHQTIAKIHVTPSDMTNLAVAETRSEQELEKYGLILVRVFEHGLDFFCFVNRTDGIDVLWPVRRFNQFDLSVTFKKLEHNDEFVINRAFAKTMFAAIGHGLQDVVACDLVHERSFAPLSKKFV